MSVSANGIASTTIITTRTLKSVVKRFVFIVIFVACCSPIVSGGQARTGQRLWLRTDARSRRRCLNKEPANAHKTPCRFLANIAHSKGRSEEHTSELQSLRHLVCRLL